MAEMDPSDRMESIASGVEQFGSLIPTATDALAESERRAQAEADGIEPSRQPLTRRVTGKLAAFLGR
jgi:hypothetical protein